MRAVKGALIAGSFGVLMAACATSANATPINISFNFVPTGTLTASPSNDVTSATSISSGAPDIVTGILTNNIGLVAGQTIALTSPTPVTMGSTFTKTFVTPDGTFVESLTVSSVTPGPSSLGIDATGTVTETVVTSGSAFDPTTVFYSAAYTQNEGPGTQINASFNDSTTPPAVPEPITLSVFGVGLAGAAALRRRKKA